MSVPARRRGPPAGAGAPPDARRLADELADLLAEALVADLQQFPQGGREPPPPGEDAGTEANGRTRAAASSAIMPGADGHAQQHPRAASDAF